MCQETLSSKTSVKVEKDDSPWGAADFSPVEDTGVASASSYDWGGDSGGGVSDPTSDDFFSQMLSESKKV